MRTVRNRWVFLTASAVAGVFLLGASGWAQTANSPVASVLLGNSPAVHDGLLEDPALRGLPYLAEGTHTTERMLADGTHITRELKKKSARDSEGRTCVIFFNKLPNNTAYQFAIIDDPVAHEKITLNGFDKTAEIEHTHPLMHRTLTPEQKAAMEAAHAKAAADKTVQAPKPPSSNSEDLGSRSIQGVYAEGKRITSVIPIGQMGNDRELQRVTEYWSSPELKIQLESTYDDPINGKRTEKVTSIDWGDPDPSLFRVPEGYKVLDKNPEAAKAQP